MVSTTLNAKMRSEPPFAVAKNAVKSVPVFCGQERLPLTREEFPSSGSTQCQSGLVL